VPGRHTCPPWLAPAGRGGASRTSLSSTSLATDISGAPVAETRYLPYGEERWITGTLVTDFTFTGQRAERGFGLMDYNARYYDPWLGRFVSADTVVPEPGNPQALNRYAYTANNPLKYVDPSGNCHGLSGAAFDTCVKTVVAIASGVHKANEYRDDIFFPDADTTFMDRLEASVAVGGGATLVGAVASAGTIAVAGTETVTALSTSSATALAGSGASAGANLIGQAVNKAETSESIDYGEVVIAGTTGYVAGALAPIGATTYAGAAALGGLNTTGQYALTQLYTGEDIAPSGVLYNAGVGAFFGGLVGPVPKGQSPIATYAYNPETRREAILDIAYSQMAETVKVSSFARAVTSGVGTTLDWPRVQERLFGPQE
jgi:RHS repeat-associated protein